MIITIIILFILIIALAVWIGFYQSQLNAINRRLLTVVKWCELLRENQNILAKDLQRLFNESKKKDSRK